MRSHHLTRGIAVLIFVIPLLLVLCSSRSNGEGAPLPAVRTQLTLELAGPPDSDPAVLACLIPWESGEPYVSAVKYQTSLGEWTVLENWTISHDASCNLSIITFSVDLEWGCEENVMVSVTDILGSNSTAGMTVVRSRCPSLELMHLLDDGESPVKGENHFLMIAVDPDGQELERFWSVDGQRVLSDNELNVYLSEGDHVIGAELSDGQWTVRKELNVTVKGEGPGIEHDGVDLMGIAAGGFLALSILCCLSFGSIVIISYLKDRASQTTESDDDIGGMIDLAGLTCEICMNEIKEGRGRTKCRCGAVMHKGCGRREGVCPKCGREVLI